MAAAPGKGNQHCSAIPTSTQGHRQEFEEGGAELLGFAPETTWRGAPKFFIDRKPHPLINDSLRMCKK